MQIYHLHGSGSEPESVLETRNWEQVIASCETTELRFDFPLSHCVSALDTRGEEGRFPSGGSDTGQPRREDEMCGRDSYSRWHEWLSLLVVDKVDLCLDWLSSI